MGTEVFFLWDKHLRMPLLAPVGVGVIFFFKKTARLFFRVAYWSEFSGAMPEWSCPLRLPSMDAFSLSGVGILIMAWRVSLCAGVLIYISLWQRMPAVLTFVHSLRWSKYLCLFYPFSNLIIYILLMCFESSLFVLDISPLLDVCGFVFFWDKVLLCGSVWPQTLNS